MKTLGRIVIPLILVSGVFSPQLTLATSGACSSHGGVNCAAGATSLGRVQCNDGWVNSSVYFINTQECSSEVSFCPYPPSQVGCEKESDYTQLESRLRFQYIRMDPAFGANEKTEALKTCRDSINFHLHIMEHYNECVKLFYGYDPETGLLVSPSEGKITASQTILNTCIANHGARAILDASDKCTCQDNYMFNSAQQCMPAGNVCLSEYGKGGIPLNAKDCACANGYHLDGRHCIADAKPIKYIPASVKKWADDNFVFNIPCSSNKSFSEEDILICTTYSTSLYRDKYDWKIVAPPVITPSPVVTTTPTTPPSIVVGKVFPPTMAVKEAAPISKPKIAEIPKPLIVKGTTTATTSADVWDASTTIKTTSHVNEEIKVEASQPKPRSLWSRILGWFKTW